MSKEVFVPKDIEEVIFNNLLEFRKKYSSYEYINEVQNIINDWKVLNELCRFKKFNPINYKEIKYLEIGVGNGFNFINSLKDGYDIVGIEPGNSLGFEGRYQICLDLMKANNIQNIEDKLFEAVAEDLPFKDGTFDFVFSIAVLEHVNSIEETFKEADRVLKSDGIMYMNIPNYNSYFEAHYGVFWLPYIFMSKKIAKLYVRLRGIDDSFIDELNFTTPSNITKVAQKVLTGSSFKCYPHIEGPMGIFGLIYFATNTNTMQEHKIITIINKSKTMNLFARIVSAFIVKSYIFLGFAKTFNFIYFKRNS